MLDDDTLTRALAADRRRHRWRRLGRLGRLGRWLRRREEWRGRCASAAADGHPRPAWDGNWDRRGAGR